MSDHTPNDTVTEATTEEMAPVAETGSGSRPAKSAQNRLIEAYIHEASKYLELAVNDPEIHQALQARGMDAQELASAKRLIQNARDSFEARAHALGQKTGTIQELTALIEEARHEYSVFREISRASFPENAERQALSLTGEIPDDIGRFVTVATASYNAAGKVPYSVKLTKRDFGTARLEELLNQLTTLTTAAADRIEVHGTAVSQTAARDAAYEELKTFMKEWKGIARGSLRGNAVALKKLGL